MFYRLSLNNGGKKRKQKGNILRCEFVEHLQTVYQNDKLVRKAVSGKVTLIAQILLLLLFQKKKKVEPIWSTDFLDLNNRKLNFVFQL